MLHIAYARVQEEMIIKNWPFVCSKNQFSNVAFY